MSADTTGIILKTGKDMPEWRVAIVQNAECLFEYEPSAKQVEAGRAYTEGLYPSFGPTDDDMARTMAAKAAHVANAEAEAPVNAPGKLNHGFLAEYFSESPVFSDRASAKAALDELVEELEEDGGYLEYGIVQYETAEAFPIVR